MFFQRASFVRRLFQVQCVTSYVFKDFGVCLNMLEQSGERMVW